MNVNEFVTIYSGGNYAAPIWDTYVTYVLNKVVGGDMSNAADWNINANWSVTGGLATANGTSSADINQANNLPVVGKTYRVTYTITAYTSGQFKVAYGGVSTPLKNTIGTHVDDVVAVSTDRVRLGGVLPFGSIDNVSIVEVGVPVEGRDCTINNLARLIS